MFDVHLLPVPLQYVIVTGCVIWLTPALGHRILDLRRDLDDYRDGKASWPTARGTDATRSYRRTTLLAAIASMLKRERDDQDTGVRSSLRDPHAALPSVLRSRTRPRRDSRSRTSLNRMADRLEGIEFRVFRSLGREADQDTVEQIRVELTHAEVAASDEIQDALTRLSEHGYVEEYKPGRWRITPQGFAVQRSLLGEPLK
jgi:hypothetical protein